MIRKRPYTQVARTCAGLSLSLLELVLVNVSTTVAQTFVCNFINDGSQGFYVLRAQLTLPW